ncbi:FKBP-type peptidyl-prolyl cis-trans isomerase FklB [Balneicella halophila]|uniref:Peptidyl-prolyl cis-trans isomerase n=1 Tax=Balneicella halophila TaxID=1537566 RepID=A0A7L4UQ28_BALHA|nr:FKBP-type peptidyl-prolyl cis-trans isomerase [Balneicella halophila]PVX50997.1 FKBP-type peptidyl-prolyl cis-trans isomerase FklB [Balneicella halophila]
MKKYLLIVICTATFFNTAFSQEKKVPLKDMRDSLSYSIGISMGESLLRTDIDNINQAVFFEALRQKINNEETLWDMSKADSLLVGYIMGKRQAKAEENKAKGEAFLAENAKRDEVYTTPSGLQYEMLKMAEGPRPSLYSTVKCLYRGTTIDGEVFDENWNRENPIEFKVMDMIDGWVEGLQMMPIGAKWKLYIPSDLAYGERGAGRAVGANETLIFEIELLEIVSTDKPE